MLHITIDAYGCDTKRLDTLMDIYEVINKVVITMQAKAIMPPQLIPYYYGKDVADEGISAFILLKGGHFTIHTFPKKKCYFVDMLYDGFVDARELKLLLQNEFSGSSFYMKRIDRSEYEAEDLNAKDSGADFGPHYMINTRKENISYGEMVKLLDNIPFQIDMTPIARPVVLEDSVTKPSYMSGMTLIAESHIAFHYEYATKTLLMDIFSCKNIDDKKYHNMLNDIFKEEEDYSSILVFRGRAHEERAAKQDIVATEHNHWLDNIE